MFFTLSKLLTVVVRGSCVLPLTIINVHLFELPLPRTSEQSDTIPIQFVDSYLGL